ncbi:MAG: (d)CMP kinase [Pirellulaceae bacterium]|jgi:cytidylate kinase|nr:(d)CMP kinase [Pirellulaceae bacterium]
MIVTIDGPAGAGKSSVARRLAARLGFRFLDTGAMYRAVAWAATRRAISWDDDHAIEDLAARLPLTFDGQRVLVGDQDVTESIRSPEVTAVTRHVADNVRARAHLVDLQRRLACGQDIVTEGRDQGTVAFPDAACKFFLTASPAERARRRQAELAARGQPVTLADVLAQQEQRDQRDQTRAVGALAPAPDARIVPTDGMTLDQVVDQLESLVRAYLPQAQP